jgi:formate dehydrogenase subunit beta
MNTHWRIDTHGDPIGAVIKFAQTLWETHHLDGMIAPVNGSDTPQVQPKLIQDPEILQQVNPFKPVMTVNSARLVPHYLELHPSATFGVLLRPCEMRALIEMGKHDSFTLDRINTICVDCLGTLPIEDYEWRAQRKGSGDDLTQEALQFARQGGILAYRYRSACQMCSEPEARVADININVLGLPVRQHILIQTKDPEISEELHLSELTDGPAEPGLVEQHKRMIFKLAQRHRHTMERLFETLAEYLPADINTLTDQLKDCGDCRRCMDACPICSMVQPIKDSRGDYDRNQIIHWLISCVGCGMCEQACPKHLPLSATFGYIRERLSQEYNYTPGHTLELPASLN